MGLLDGVMGDSFDDPKTMGLLALAANLSSGQRFMPALSQGLLARQQIISSAAKEKQAQEMQGLLMQQHQMALQQAQQAAAKQQAMQALIPQFARSQAQNALIGGGGPTPANAARMDTASPSFDFEGYAKALAGVDPMASLQMQTALRKEGPKFSTAPQYDQNGRAFVLAEDGTMRYLNGVSARDKLIAEDLGGKKMFRTEYSANPVALANKTETPDARLSAGVTMRGQDMTDARARELNAITREGQMTQVINDPERGILMANKNTGMVRPGVGMDGKPLAGEASVKRENAAKRTIPLLDEADKLIDQATGSYVGAGVDLAGRAVGYSTEGAKATAKLKVLEGNLMLSQPRMEGPQSDKDTMLYKQMAGQIGDPTVPADIKKAALATIRQIHQKYAGGAPLAKPAMEVPGLKFLGFEGQ